MTSSSKSGTVAAKRIKPQSGIEVTSIAASFKIGCAIDLEILKHQIVNFEFNTQKHNAMIIRQRDPRVTLLLFSSGSCVITGAISEESIKKAVRQFLRRLQKLGYLVKYNGYQVNSVSGAFNTGFPLDVTKLQNSGFGRFFYNPERFCGGVLRYEAKKSAMIFHTGAVTMAGAKSIKELEEDYSYILFITHSLRNEPLREESSELS